MTSAAALSRHPGLWSLPEMAPDQPLVPDVLSRPGALQRLSIFVVASEIMLNHLGCVEHGVADVPAGWPDTTDTTDGKTERHPVDSIADQGSAAPANPYARSTVRILARTPRNWTPQLIAEMDDVGRRMLDKAIFPNGIGAGKARTGIAPTPADWVRGSRQVIAMMCPPRRWNDALTALNKRQEGSAEFTRREMEAARARIEAFALQHPMAAIHASAAQVAWLSLQPKVVPDWTAWRTELAREMDEMKHKITTYQSRV